MPYLGRPVTNAGQFEIIDDISSDFDGSDVSFTLQVGGTDILPDASNVTIVLDGVVQIPSSAYSITGSTINFSEAPADGVEFHGVLAGQSQFIESDFIVDSMIKSTANISGSKINTDFSAQTVKAAIFEGMVSGSAQLADDISGSFSKEHLGTKVANVVTSSAQIAADISGSFGNQRVGTSDSPTFAGGTVTGDFAVGGTLTAQEVHTEFESASILFTSGSTKFGDTIDDTHEVTGSMTMSGSLTVNNGALAVENITIDSSDINNATGNFTFSHNGTEKLRITSDKVMFSADAKVDANNTRDLGTSGARWKDLYLAGNIDVDGTSNLDAVDIDGDVDLAGILTTAGSTSSNYVGSFTNTSAQGWGLFIKGGADNADYTLRVQDKDAGDLLSVKGGGRIGVNNNDPDGTLDVMAADGYAYFTTTSPAAFNMIFRSGSADPQNNWLGQIEFTGNTSARSQIVTRNSTTLSLGSNNVQTLHITDDDKVGIGETVPLATLHVKEGDSGLSSLNGSGTNLFLEANGANAAGMTIASGNTANGYIIFGDSDSNFRGAIQYDHSTPDRMHLVTAGSQRLSIDQNGNTGIGTNTPGDIRLVVRDNDTSTGTGDPVTTGTNASSSLFRVQPRFNSGLDIGQGASPYPIWIQAVDVSDLSQFYELSLNPVGGNVGIGTLNPGTALEVHSDGNSILTLNADRTGTSGQDNAGIYLENQNSSVWAIRYSSGDSNRLEIYDAGFDDGVQLAQGGSGFSDISDERAKTDLVTITDAVDKVNSLRAVNFKWKYGNEERRTKNNIGIIAQDVYKVLPEAVYIPENDYEVVDHPIYEGEKQAKNLWTVDKSKLTVLLVKAVQELTDKNEALEKRIEELEK